MNTLVEDGYLLLKHGPKFYISFGSTLNYDDGTKTGRGCGDYRGDHI